jgi:hypothetical protein
MNTTSESMHILSLIYFTNLHSHVKQTDVLETNYQSFKRQFACFYFWIHHQSKNGVAVHIQGIFQPSLSMHSCIPPLKGDRGKQSKKAELAKEALRKATTSEDTRNPEGHESRTQLLEGASPTSLLSMQNDLRCLQRTDLFPQLVVGKKKGGRFSGFNICTCHVQ